MNKKILFVVPIRSRYNVSAIDMGLLYLASAARRVGWEPQILHCGVEKYSYKKFASFIRSNHFDVIGFKCLSYDFTSLQKHASIIRAEQPETMIVMGGPHPSGIPRESLESSPDFNFVWRGEGEIGLPMLLERFTEVKAGESKVLREIPGLVWRDSEAVMCNEQVFVEDLSSLGMPAWDLINPLRFPDTTMGGRYIPLITTRGCPYLCTNCSAFNVVGRKLRFRSIDAIIEELKHLIQKYGIKKYSVIDDNFTFNHDFALGLCERIKSENLDIQWDCGNGVRLDTMTSELLRAMEAAGCYSVSVGIESGSPRILKSLRKHLTVETIKEKVALIKSCTKIKVTGFHMIGYPGETIAEIKKTIQLACELPLNKANFSLVIPFPGTGIWYDLIKKGLLDPRRVDWDSYHIDTGSFKQPGIKNSELLRLQRQAYLSFYLRPQIIKGILKQILLSRNMHRALLRKVISVFLRR